MNKMEKACQSKTSCPGEYQQMVDRVKRLYEKATFAKQLGAIEPRARPRPQARLLACLLACLLDCGVHPPVERVTKGRHVCAQFCRGIS